MNENLHARSEKLIAQERIEGISLSERDWLAAHLRECHGCAQVAQQTNDALRTLRAMAIPLPRGLAERTRFRVQLRAQELREREPKRRLLWIMCAMSWGSASPPLRISGARLNGRANTLGFPNCSGKWDSASGGRFPHSSQRSSC